MLRRICMMICALGLIAATAPAQPAPAPAGPPPTGSGPYSAVIEGDSGLPGHTVYRPENLSPFNKNNSMPVVAWGNGGCANSSTFYAPFLAEIASQGFLVVAIGPYTPNAAASRGGGMGGGMGSATKSSQLIEALDWATAENKRQDSKYYQKLDPAKFAVFGHSCGGLQALEVAPDSRVSTILVMDSGIFGAGGAPKIGMPQGGAPKMGAPEGAPQGGTPQGGAPKMPAMGGAMSVGKDVLQKLHSPVIYIIGGEKDIAYPQAIDDFAKIDKVPVAMANLDVGHGGTYSQPNGGEFGRVAVAWLKWQLKKDDAAGKMFAGKSCGLCKDDKWKFEKKKLD
jgi:dienelactone hydrolase